MNLNDFEQKIDPKIVDRGYNYFFDGLVDGPEQAESGVWLARVYGTVPYEVEIHTNPHNNRKISSWNCSCPYDYGPVCKHVVAAFYVMAQQKEEGRTESSPKNPKQKTRKEKVQTIFDEAAKDDLQEFILACFKSVDGLENRFIAHFADRLNEDSWQKYRTIIRNYGRAARGRHGFIDYRSAPTLTRPLFDLNQKAMELLEAGNILECQAVCQTLIEEVPVFLESMDDSDGGAGGVISSAFDTLYELIDDASSEVKDKLFGWCMEEFSKEKYQEFGFEDHFLDLLPSLVSNVKQEEDFFDLLDRQIEHEKSKLYSEYRVNRLIKTKIDYLQVQNRDDQIVQLLETHNQVPDFRMRLVDRALEAGNFDTAKIHCEEGIKIAREKNHVGTEGRWHEKLFDIAKQQDHVPGMRKWAEILFFGRYASMKWYRALKDTYPKEEWPKKCEEIIKRLKKTGASGYHANMDTLAHIFVEENYTDQLLKLIKQDPEISFVDHYAGNLSKAHPYELLDLYEQGISDYATQTGRKHYRKVAGWLRRMTKIKGGDEQAYALFKQFFRKYDNRPAMKEELGRAFPQWTQAVDRK